MRIMLALRGRLWRGGLLSRECTAGPEVPVISGVYAYSEDEERGAEMDGDLKREVSLPKAIVLLGAGGQRSGRWEGV